MNMKLLKLLGISFAISIIVLSGCNKKNKLPRMKIGNYSVTDIRTYSDGTVSTLMSEAIGPYETKNGQRILFKIDSLGTVITHEYNMLSQKDKSSVFYDISDRITFDVIDYSISKTELSVDRAMLDGSFSSKITYKYID